jgi:hypothetical protein
VVSERLNDEPGSALLTEQNETWQERRYLDIDEFAE